MRPRIAHAVLLLLATLSLAGCSLHTFAASKIGDSIAAGGVTFASDDDPELVAQALPFSLKLMESLLSETPSHRGLLLATASGYTQYSYAFVQQEGDELQSDDLDRATQLHERAARLYLRARDYGLRGLDAAHPGFSEVLRSKPNVAVGALHAGDVPLAYWTAAAWGLAISLSKTEPELVADQLVVEALIDRALDLDEDFDRGAIHGFLISYEPSRQGVGGDPDERCRRHYARAVELTGGQLASPHVALAESLFVMKQDRKAFETVLQTALAIDANARPEWRLANLVAQRRAQWLLGRVDELFIQEEGEQ